jgi:hypothetical protein
MSDLRDQERGNNRLMEMVLEVGREGAFSNLFSTLEGCEGGEAKKVQIAPAPSKEVLDIATCHKPLFS